MSTTITSSHDARSASNQSSLETFQSLLHSKEEAEAIFNILKETGLLSSKNIKKAVNTIIKEGKLKEKNTYFRNPENVRGILKHLENSSKEKEIGIKDFKSFEELLSKMTQKERVAFLNYLKQSFFRLPGEERAEQNERLKGFFDDENKNLIKHFQTLGLTLPSPKINLNEKGLTIAIPGATATRMALRIEHLINQKIGKETPVYFLTGERAIFNLDKESGAYKLRLKSDDIEIEGNKIIEEILKIPGKTEENLSEQDLAEYIAKKTCEKHNLNLKVLIGDREKSLNSTRVDTFATVYKLGEEILENQPDTKTIKVALFSNDEFRNGQGIGALSALIKAMGILDDSDLTFEKKLNENENENTLYFKCFDPKTNSQIIVYPQGANNTETKLNIGLPSQTAAFLYGLTNAIYPEVAELNSLTQGGRVHTQNQYEQNFLNPIADAIQKKKEVFDTVLTAAEEEKSNKFLTIFWRNILKTIGISSLKEQKQESLDYSYFTAAMGEAPNTDFINILSFLDNKAVKNQRHIQRGLKP